jgi:hypothetical protein
VESARTDYAGVRTKGAQWLRLPNPDDLAAHPAG